MRGKHSSKPIEQIINEAKILAKNGTKELVIIAQDSTYYGLDLYGKRNLGDALLALNDVEGIDWIRLQYAYPSQFPMDILPIIKHNPKICNYLDMPLQHTADNMLKAMRRGITTQRTQELIDQIRNQIPNIALRTTLISGFPNESTQDHQDLLQFVEHNRFERLGVFAYSHEEQTAAFNLIDNIPEETKQERVSEIMELQQGISLELNQQKIGQTFKVLFDRKENNYFVGRTEFDSPEVDNEVLVDAKESKNFIRIGDFASINITSASEFDLYGTVVNQLN